MRRADLQPGEAVERALEDQVRERDHGLPLGLVVSGLLIDHIGYPLTITASAAVGLLFTLLIALRWRRGRLRAAGRG